MAIRPAQHVVQLFGICNDARDGKLRIVMELCTHGSLRDYVNSLSPSYWTVERAVDVFLQLACGVKHLHACCVLHRDLKTDNALIAGLLPLVVKWADFGCSVKLDGKAAVSTYGDDGMKFHCASCPLAVKNPHKCACRHVSSESVC
jgi:serine/threonine protein kinase